MRTLDLLLAAALSLVASASTAQTEAVVAVVFTPKVRFFDAGDTRRDVERTEAMLSSHLQALGKRWLAPGAKLRVEVTEIDLAGRIPAGRQQCLPDGMKPPGPQPLHGACPLGRVERRLNRSCRDANPLRQCRERQRLLEPLDHVRLGLPEGRRRCIRAR